MLGELTHLCINIPTPGNYYDLGYYYIYLRYNRLFD